MLPPKANQIKHPAPPAPPVAPQPAMLLAKVSAPSTSTPPSWSVDTVRIVPANGGGQRAPRSPNDDVAATSPDKVRRQQLAE